MQWRCSYETVLFDTNDGDLGKNEFCYRGKKWIKVVGSDDQLVDSWWVRKHPKNNFNFVITTDPSDIAGKKEVFVSDPKGAYYDEFILTKDRILRRPSIKNEYYKLQIKDQKQPEVELSKTEVADVIKEDSSWQ